MSQMSPIQTPAPESDWLQSWASSLPLEARKAKLAAAIQAGTLDDEEAQAALYAWDIFWARANQLPPAGDWATWLLLAGRGFGKTRTIVEWARAQAALGIGPGAIVARTAADVRDVLIEGPAGLMACSPPWFRPTYEPSKRRLTWPNGVVAITFSAEQPDQLRGPQHAWAICDELAAWQHLADAWSNLQLGLRLGASPRAVVATTPRPVAGLRELLREPDTVATRGATFDNAVNLAAKALDYFRRRYEGTRLGRQELAGELLDDLPGALWTRAMCEEARRRGEPWSSLAGPARELFRRIVVAVDPSGSNGADKGDDQGIVVAGEIAGTAGRPEYVILQDLTGQRSPLEWARVAAQACQDWGADRIIAEGNYGGEMVRATLAQAAPNAPVKLLHASQGKRQRAEPIAALYEQQRVHHARSFPALEDEFCQFTTSGYQGGASPNRADAAIWALTELAHPHIAPRIRAL